MRETRRGGEETRLTAIRDIENVEQREIAGEDLSSDEQAMLLALTEWRQSSGKGNRLMGGPIFAVDKRSISQYRAEVERYLASLRRALRAAAWQVYDDSHYGDLPVYVKNGNEKPVEALEVAITLPDGVEYGVKLPKNRLRMPNTIHEYGDSISRMTDFDSHNHLIALQDSFGPKPSEDGPSIGDRSIRYSDIGVTGDGEVALPRFRLVTNMAAGQVFELRWNAAAKKSTPGRSSGVFRVHVNKKRMADDEIRVAILTLVGAI